MQTKVERRRRARVSVCGLEDVFRQCDVQVIVAGDERDVVIEDISPLGVRFVLDGSGNGVVRGDQVFIRGCAFHDLIGFLSSATATVKWARDRRCGLQFDRPLDLDDPDLQAAIKAVCGL
jgi:hypothetical protein